LGSISNRRYVLRVPVPDGARPSGVPAVWAGADRLESCHPRPFVLDNGFSPASPGAATQHEPFTLAPRCVWCSACAALPGKPTGPFLAVHRSTRSTTGASVCPLLLAVSLSETGALRRAGCGAREVRASAEMWYHAGVAGREPALDRTTLLISTRRDPTACLTGTSTTILANT
jgi:hypothetical protein